MAAPVFIPHNGFIFQKIQLVAIKWRNIMLGSQLGDALPSCGVLLEMFEINAFRIM